MCVDREEIRSFSLVDPHKSILLISSNVIPEYRHPLLVTEDLTDTL